MNNLSQIRGQLGITQRQLANHIGWSQPRIANYETGLRSPLLSVAQKIVQTLNLTWGKSLYWGRVPVSKLIYQQEYAMASNKLTWSARVLSDQVIEKYYSQKQYEVDEGRKPRLAHLVALLVMKILLRHLTLSPIVNSVFLIRIRTLRLRKVNLKCYSLCHKALISGYVRSIWVNKKATVGTVAISV